MSAAHSSPFRRARFEAALNEQFRVSAFAPDGSSANLSLTLFEINMRPSPPGYEQFSSLFRGAATPALEQGMYAVESDAFGAEMLFLVPVGLTEDGSRLYEAFVNRKIEA